MQLYYFTKAEHALSNISLRRLKISRLDKLNDPFEWLGPACEKPGDRFAFRALKDQMAPKSGLICFTEDWTNPVQWSHYADHHKGIALGFAVDQAVATKVHYEDERTVIKDLETVLAGLKTDEDTHNWMVREVICRKFRHWEYEQEWRSYINFDPNTLDDGNYFMDFNPQMKLNRVLVGANCNVKKATLQRAIGELKGVELMKTRLAFKTFSICEQLDPKRFP